MAPDRFDTTGHTRLMKAVVTTGNGGYDRLVYRDVPIPVPAPQEVLIRVAAAGVNNTEINTRLGWYSNSVTADTAGAAATEEREARHKADGGWDKPTPFPFIQGTDCCGHVVEAGCSAGAPLIGKRVLVRPCMRRSGFGSLETIWMASDFDGAFAEYVKVPASEVFPVSCGWSDIELATIPCAYGSAENMLNRARLGAGETVLITGASGGVGSAAVQLAKCRGARIIGLTSAAKHNAVKALGCDLALNTSEDLIDALGESSIDLAVDNVAGTGFGTMPRLLKRGGRLVSSGAIGGPIVQFDMRDFYLKDLTFIGCTAWDEPVFPRLISLIEQGRIRPLVAGIYPLARIADAQRAFMRKEHVGKFVLVPPSAAGN
ncbi:alcohol dehydrogenase family protein [Aestuariivirga sp.]|jgi:NADPH:quinone reductase-like Zn-dependent oxidoreductase|uniref:alcohol dehydrogenase family protein n=1 Tax=Aestuariivirga sp. TaxID=2650926 RepID=UPI00378316F2